MVKAIFFDLYETLITEYDPNWKSGRTVEEQLGMKESQFKEEWRVRQKDRMTGVYKDYPSVLRDICKACEVSVDEHLIKKLHTERVENKAFPFQRIENHVLKALSQIKEMDIKIGLVSNCTPEEITAWPTSSLADYFNEAIFSYQVGCQKPDREIYDLACKRLKVKPEESIFVGDGGSNELWGADRANLTPYWATWFLDRWPSWKRSGQDRNKSEQYPRLTKISQLVEIMRGDQLNDCK